MFWSFQFKGLIMQQVFFESNLVTGAGDAGHVGGSVEYLQGGVPRVPHVIQLTPKHTFC